MVGQFGQKNQIGYHDFMVGLAVKLLVSSPFAFYLENNCLIPLVCYHPRKVNLKEKLTEVSLWGNSCTSQFENRSMLTGYATPILSSLIPNIFLTYPTAYL